VFRVAFGVSRFSSIRQSTLVTASGDENVSENKTNDKIGAVAVIGGGVGGIQASLDLAESGYKVYLIDKSPSIGGVMAQLDKTFPTNDCSMCILSPKMVDCGRHRNIVNLTYSEVEALEGEAGRFKLKVRKKARSVDESLCTGCGECVNHCLVQSKPYLRTPVTGEEEFDLQGKPVVDEILSRYPLAPHSLISVLQDINLTKRYLPKGDLKYVAVRLSVPLSVVYHVATFYTAFSLTPRGKHLIQVCMGTACHVRGSKNVLNFLQRTLKVEAGETTKDLAFSLETVNCLGACAIGPVVVVDGEYHGEMNMRKTDQLIEHYLAEEKEEEKVGA
jgi:NADH:ubiquinone oxidoreductase subunit E